MTNLVKIQVDGREIEVPHGTTVMEAANRLGIYVPHFCYHKKLSIAANCRMCLVQVEKAPKPLPACATPVTEGMKAWTHSEQAKQAQNGVMEFLLINHPLDCPICDQGGECQLQDLAVGYGYSNSRYKEPKRVVLRKELGPLVAAEEMSRCIQCTRCVRFGQEVAGMMELGMIGRGEHAEIVSFVGRSVDSELSGNMIDLCPVGALTSRPFRYTARPWELGRRKSISPHDGLGSNLVVQTSVAKVMRVLPLENEELNECWLSDKDRFSYEGLNSPERLLKPMVRDGGAWREADWQHALERAAAALSAARQAHGGEAIGVLASPHSTLEELYLAQKLARGLGSENVDFRLRQSDFSGDARLAGAPWLGMKVAELGALDRVLVIGSNLRKDHPLIARRLREAAKRAQQVSFIHVADDDQLIKLANKLIVSPADLVRSLGEVVKAAAEARQQPVPDSVEAVQVSEAARAIAASLASGRKAAIFLGNAAQHHPQAAALHALVQELARLTGARFGFLGEAANSVGGYMAGCVPGKGGLGAAAMLDSPRKAYLLLNVEPELDCHNPQHAMRAMNAADAVVVLSAFRTRASEYAQVLLPVAPFTETSGSFINTEGRLQSFNPAILPAAAARPAWKVLRVLGNLMGLEGFGYDTSEAIRDAACAAGIESRLDNALRDGGPAAVKAAGTEPQPALQRIAEVPIYFADALVRRAPSLQLTRDARPPRARAHPDTLGRLGVAAGSKVRVRQGGGDAVVDIVADPAVPRDCIRLAAAHPATAGLGAMFGEISVEAA
jgi:NADH-quinone oxidoreductase subunit G